MRTKMLATALLAVVALAAPLLATRASGALGRRGGLRLMTRRRILLIPLLVASTLILTASGVTSQQGDADESDAGAPRTATAHLVGPDGRAVGTVTLIEGPNGVLVQADVAGLSPGVPGGPRRPVLVLLGFCHISCSQRRLPGRRPLLVVPAGPVRRSGRAAGGLRHRSGHGVRGS